MEDKLKKVLEKTIKELKADAKKNPDKAGMIKTCIDYLQAQLVRYCV